MNVDPHTRRTNRLIMIALVIFAVGFCVAILLWMRMRTLRQGGKVYPPTSLTVPTEPRNLPVATAFVFDSSYLPSL